MSQYLDDCVDFLRIERESERVKMISYFLVPVKKELSRIGH